MANDIDDNVYLDNNDLIVARPRERVVNDTTGEVEEIVLSGLTLKYYLAASENAASHLEALNAALVIDLAEDPAGVYVGTLTGAAKRSHLATVPHGETVWRHWQDGTTYHVAKEVVVRHFRPTEDA